METYYDIQQLLKQFGIYIYTGQRENDKLLSLIELEELYKSGLISQKIYLQAVLILKRND